MPKFNDLTPRKTAGYGWKPDLPDRRDLKFKPRYGALKATPSAADLTKTKGYFPAYTQEQLGSCTANAIAAALQFDALIQGTPMSENPSRLFIYYGERVIEGTVPVDSGASLRDGIKVVATYGAPPESAWPYDTSQFKTTPPKPAFDAAKSDTALTYKSLSESNTLDQLKAAISGENKPVLFGFTVYESFEGSDVAAKGLVPVPQPGEAQLGGHAVLAVGYDDAKGCVKVRNSWGPDWGMKGHFWLPYSFFTTPGMSQDFWVIETVGQAAA